MQIKRIFLAEVSPNNMSFTLEALKDNLAKNFFVMLINELPPERM